MERVRFAPSPTGYLHIGGARTALFNFLYARQKQGTFILRIEDTDLQRSSKESEEVIIRDLQWLSIEWDEGVGKGGDYGPYRSTERLHIYKEYVEKLLEEGKAYYCYCTPEELEQQRKQLLEKGEMPRYTGKCREMTRKEREALEARGLKPVIRFKVPQNQTISVNDLIRGKVEFDSSGIGDFVIVKSNGIPVYNFAVVIDDHLMKITNVIRGEEHLSNTPRQILIYKALGFELPKFAHVPLILGKDRTKMSKRHGSTWVEHYRDQGYLPDAIVNFLALLGWSPEGEQEFFTIEELVEQFSFDRVAKNPAIFDIDKLNWMNSHYIKKSPLDKITRLCVPYLIDAGFIQEDEVEAKFEWLKQVVETVRESLTVLSEIPAKTEIFFKDKISLEEENVHILKREHVKELINAFLKLLDETDRHIDDNLAKQIFKKVQKTTGVKGKNLYMPMRIMLTGKTHGPELFKVCSIMGKERLIKRLEYVKQNMIQ
jgi:nondiscriminating glutamyl-tRNA synthetase